MRRCRLRVPAPRPGNAKRHDLLEMLTIALTAFASATRLVVGQQSFRVSEGDSEILAARALLACLALEGRLVTADAIHCQTETAQAILERGGDYLLRVKANRPALHAMGKDCFADPQSLAAAARAVSTDAGHGRIETRRAWVRPELGWLRGPKSACTEPVPLPEMACVGMIEAHGAIGVERRGKTAVTRHYHARRHCRRGSRPQPQGSRSGKPRHPAQTRPQPAPKRTTRHLHPPKTIRMVKQLRKINPRPNAIAVFIDPPGLDDAAASSPA